MGTPIFLHVYLFQHLFTLTCVEITSIMNCISEEKRTKDRDNSANRCSTKDCITPVCPSKLSKHELEELYFALIENNLELKKRVNAQDDQLRQLSTKMQRLTATQKTYTGHNGGGGGGKERACCEGFKAIIDDQKHVITEIQEANEKLTERIKHLNMQLDSTKQFLKKTTPPGPPKKPGARPGPVRPSSAANKPVASRNAVSGTKTPTPRTPASPKTQPKHPKTMTPTRDAKLSTPTRDKPVTQASSRGSTPTRDFKPGTQTSPRDVQSKTQTSPRDVQSRTQTSPRDVQSRSSLRDGRPGIHTSSDGTPSTITRDVQSKPQTSPRGAQSRSQASSTDGRPGTQTSSRDGTQPVPKDVRSRSQPSAKDVQSKTQTSPRDLQSKTQTPPNLRPGTQTSSSDGTPNSSARDVQSKSQASSEGVGPGTQALSRDATQPPAIDLQPMTPACSIKSSEQYKKCQEMKARESKSTSTPIAPTRHASTSMLDPKSGPKIVYDNKKSVECQCGDGINAKVAPKKACDENICSTEIESLKQKIVYLQEELSKTHKEYSSRITRLEREISEVRIANMRAENDTASLERTNRLREQDVRTKDAKLREEQKNAVELDMQLQIERGKVAELLTQLKAASITNQVANTLEEHLRTRTQTNANPREDNLMTANEKLLIDHFVNQRQSTVATGTAIRANTSTAADDNSDCGCGEEVSCGCERGVGTREQQNPTRDIQPTPVSPKPKRKNQDERQITEPPSSSKSQRGQDDSQSIKKVNKEAQANANNQMELIKSPEDRFSSDDAYYIKIPDHDSGFTDPKTFESEEEKERALMKQDLIRRINDLQNQLVNLKESASSRTQTQSNASPLNENSRSEETYNIDLTFGEYPSSAGVDPRKRKMDKPDNDRSKSLNEANLRWVNYDRPNGPAQESIKIDAQQYEIDENQLQNRRQSKPITENQRYQIPGPIPTDCNTRGERCNRNTPSQVPRRASVSSKAESHRSNASETGQSIGNRRDSVNVTQDISSGSPSFIHRESFQMGKDIGKMSEESPYRNNRKSLDEIKNSLEKLRYGQPHGLGIDNYELKGNQSQGPARNSDSSDASVETNKGTENTKIPPSTSIDISRYISTEKPRRSIPPSTSIDITHYTEKDIQAIRPPTSEDVTPYADIHRPSIPPSTSLEITPFRTENKANLQRSFYTEEEASTSKGPRNSLYPPPPPSNSRPSSSGPRTVGNQTTNLGEKRDVAVSSDVITSLDICEKYAHVCNCPRVTRRDVAVFRSCSGTLCFRTTDVGSSLFRKCRCGKSDDITTDAQSNRPEISRGDDTSITSQKSMCSNQSCLTERPGMGLTMQTKELAKSNSPTNIIVDRGNTPEPTRDFKEELIIPERIKRISKVEHTSSKPEPNLEYSQTKRKSRNETHSRQTSPMQMDSKEAPVQFCLVSQTPNFFKANSAQTYILRGSAEVVRCNRATYSGDNYDNTDREISSMTDLPSEREMLWTPRSPGEDKATTMVSYTDSCTTPTPPTAHTRTEYNTYSEGEIPQDRASRLMNYAEIQAKDNISDGEHPTPRETSSQKMELALQAIGEELALCRRLLLQTQRPPQQPPKPMTRDFAADSCPSPAIALHRAEPQTTLGDAFTPRCLFVLHIGTVVLSDEAVMASRDMSLIMTWQFYDQNVAMTRMRAGRVMHFDFATEYDVKLTDNFLDYLKYEEMQIKICEINKQNEPFATCSLPLRDALLHTNRRADVSLALISGPRMQHSKDTDVWDSGDEVGVLDLWCMLRAEPRLLPRINKSIAKVGGDFRGANSSVRPSTAGVIMPQINEDQDDNASTDIDLISLPASKSPYYDYPKTLIYPTRVETEEDLDSMTRGGDQPVLLDPINPSTSSGAELGTINADKTGVSFDNNKWGLPSYDRRTSTGFLINEVPTNIRSTNEMKKAIEKGIKEPYFSPRVQMKEDKNFARNPKDKQRMSLTSITTPEKEMISESQPSQRQGEHNPYKRPSEPNNDEGSENTVLSKRYDNVSKLLNSKKELKPLPDALKKVKIDNERLQGRRPSGAGATHLQEAAILNHLQAKTIDITVMWLALNEECDAMNDMNVQKLYVAYTFLGHSGAELETPISLPKPKNSTEKCYFNFKKTFNLTEGELSAVGRMAKCRTPSKAPSARGRRECITFSVVSEPHEDPLGLNNCEDVGHAYLYFGDLLQYSAGNDSYVEVLPVQGRSPDDVCGVLAIRVDGLNVVRKCQMMAQSDTWRTSF